MNVGSIDLHTLLLATRAGLYIGHISVLLEIYGKISGYSTVLLYTTLLLYSSQVIVHYSYTGVRLYYTTLIQQSGYSTLLLYSSQVYTYTAYIAVA